ncbi:hypothetical protein CAC42_4356 [Sphaceloma murrayae]|uniref:Beta-xylosidase C-terminal Concanavalin A-like domain-containing protein n=1 Tax=Sphaceloma murrayae TaxID=2082308 RepID=A0A2K1QLB8_9PEZI|nr:hypothetical protein CAC42_4356 [Sphaceloma murrayae]
MKLDAIAPLLTTLLTATTLVSATGTNSTFRNPILPGWHSDPSCVNVDSTFFCATSTFLLTPGIPLYASKDLINWRLASHVLTRPSQLPIYNQSTDQNDGIFAPTLRYRDGVFYVITVYVNRTPGNGDPRGLLFATTDPFSSASWSDPVIFKSQYIDPDLFWDDDGQAYVSQADITQNTIDLATGELGPEVRIWNGTGGVYPEGPHIYKRDDAYYLLIAEGGTELGHTVTVARSDMVDGEYVGADTNPILTARNTSNYFQTVGHADLFQDANGNWWATALATRSGPEWVNYPMGRETVLTPARWDEGEFPVIDPVFGEQQGWPLPERTRDVPGEGEFLGDEEDVSFGSGDSLPKTLSYWRWPGEGLVEVVQHQGEGRLRIKPSPALTQTDDDLTIGRNGLGLVLRLQEHTLFTFSIQLDFDPSETGEEAGITVWLTQRQHIDLGVVQLPESVSRNSRGARKQLRLRTVGVNTTIGLQEDIIAPLPRGCENGKMVLTVRAKNDTSYTFSVSAKGRREEVVIGSAPATITSGGTGPFTGTLVGAYASSNGGGGTTPAYISRWRYRGDAQKIDSDRIVPV